MKEIEDNNKIFDLLKNINNHNNIKDKLNDILNLYDNMNLNVMTIIYKINKNEDKLKLFSQTFIKNNKENCYLIINGEKSELKENIDINKREVNKLEVKLFETKTITNMSYIFYDCGSLQSLPDINKWDTKSITNMSYMFYKCSSLKSLPDISKWDTKNVIDMSSMFYDCSSLQSLPDISKWNTKKVAKMNKMFNGIKKDIIPKNFKMC